MAVTEEQIQAEKRRRQQAVQQSEQPGVTDEQIQAEIQRRQVQSSQAPAIQDANASINAATPPITQSPAQEITQPAIQDALKPQQANLGEFSSRPLTLEERKQEKLFEIEAVSKKTQQQREISGRSFLEGKSDIKSMGVFELMEAVNQSKTFTNPKKRRQAVAELKRRGVAPDIVETFTMLDEPGGFMQSLKDEAFVGGSALVASGVVGALTKSPKAAAGAAAVAGGAAELAEEGFNRAFRPERARDPLELGTDVLKTTAREGISDLVGGKIIGKLGKGLKMASGKLVAGGRIIEGAQEISDELAKAGLDIKPGDIPEFFGKRLPNIQAGLDPAQKTSSKFNAFMIGSIEKAFGGNRLLERKEIVNPVALKKLVSQNMDSLMGDIARLSPSQIGGLADDAFVGSQQAFRNIDGINFTRFKEAVNAGGRNPQVSMKANRKMAQKLLRKVEDGQLLEGFDEDKAFIKAMAKGKALSTGIEDAITNRSNLNSMVQRLPKGSNARRLANEMKQIHKTEMIKTAKGVSDKAFKLGEEAYAYSTQARKTYQAKILELVSKDVADGTPHRAIGTIFEPEGVTRINQVKDVLLSKEGKSAIDIQKHGTAWDELRFGWLRDQVKQASTVDDIPLDGEALSKVFQDMGEETMGAMFSKGELAQINHFTKAMRLVQKQATGGSAELVRFLQVGAAAGGRFGGKPGLMFSALGGPAVIARLMTDKAASRALLGGKTGQFIALMAKTKSAMKKEKQKIDKLEIEAIRQEGIRLGQRDELL